TDGGGARRITRAGFVSYGVNDGLGGANVVAISEASNGELLVFNRSADGLFISRPRNRGFETVKVNLPAESVSDRWKGVAQVAVERQNQWWIGNNQGLARFDRIHSIGELGRAKPSFFKDIILTGAVDNLTRLYHDASGGIWLSGQHAAGNRLARWEP